MVIVNFNSTKKKIINQSRLAYFDTELNSVCRSIKILAFDMQMPDISDRNAVSFRNGYNIHIIIFKPDDMSECIANVLTVTGHIRVLP